MSEIRIPMKEWIADIHRAKKKYIPEGEVDVSYNIAGNVVIVSTVKIPDNPPTGMGTSTKRKKSKKKKKK